MKRLPMWMLLPAASLLAACAGPGLTPLQGGLSESELTQRWGTPTGRYTLGSGTRLEYALGPAGRETWMVDLDAQGRVAQWRQVLDWRHLERVQGSLPGMSTDELLRTLGRASHVRSGGRQGGEVWSWRHDSPFCLWFQASIGDDDRVRDASFAPDPECDARDDYDG
ncbi:MAG: hypothetical protein H6933_00875 [Burkholderiaceae bacterium]|nr:hypothetical protein [Burkholderiaceae bacterium]